MGAGKSYWGRELAAVSGWRLLDLDERIVDSKGMSIAEIFSRQGEDYFRQLERTQLQAAADQDDSIIACGGGTPCYFDNMAFMNRRGLTVWLNARLDDMVARVAGKREKRPLLSHLSDDALAAFMAEKLAQREPIYRQARLIVDPAEHTPHSLHEKIRQCIEHT